jgi:hypothetical protein
MGDDDLSRERAERRARLQFLEAHRPPIEADVQALSGRLQSDRQLIDDICERIEATLHLSVAPDARSTHGGADSGQVLAMGRRIEAL